MAELPLTPGSEPESITSVKQDLRTELDTHVQIMMQQLRNEQAANAIQLSQLNASQMQYLAEEVKRATVANREQEIRQEKLMQMLIQAQLTPESKQDPRASSRRSPPPKVSQNCLCGKPAEALVVKKEGPRKGRMFWKCVQRRCDFFEWIPEAEMADIDDAKTAASSLNPRRSKSPKREAPAAAPAAVPGSTPYSHWSRVSITSSPADVPVVDVDDFEG